MFVELWLKFRIISGALQLILITFVLGFQESHELCQAATAPLQLSEGQLCEDCPEQDTESKKSRLEEIFKITQSKCPASTATVTPKPLNQITQLQMSLKHLHVVMPTPWATYCRACPP